MSAAAWAAALAAGAALIYLGSELFAEHLGAAAARLGVSAFALGLLLAGAEPEELATVVTASVRGAPGVALGDVVGANVAVCLVALGVGALAAPLALTGRVRAYALGGLPLGVLAVLLAWDGRVGRVEGGVLVACYAAYVGVIWARERRSPALGEAFEAEEAAAAAAPAAGAGGPPRRAGRELALAISGVAAMAAGALVLVEAVERLTGVEETQTRLGVTVIGFATAFELVVLAWSAARRRAPEAALAGVVGSFAYNATMTLGAGALARPLALGGRSATSVLRLPLALMPVALVVPLLLAGRAGRLDATRGAVLLGCYAAFAAAVALTPTG